MTESHRSPDGPTVAVTGGSHYTPPFTSPQKQERTRQDDYVLRRDLHNRLDASAYMLLFIQKQYFDEASRVVFGLHDRDFQIVGSMETDPCLLGCLFFDKEWITQHLL